MKKNNFLSLIILFYLYLIDLLLLLLLNVYINKKIET